MSQFWYHLKGGLIQGYTNFKLINLMNYQVINLTNFCLLQQESLLQQDAITLVDIENMIKK